MSAPPCAVWTDFGGVLTPPVGESLRNFCADAGVPVAVLQAAMRIVAAGFGVDDAMAPLDTPLTDQRTWERLIEQAAAALGSPVDLSDFPSRWFGDRPPNSAWIENLRALRTQGMFVGLLSNMPPAWDAHWRSMVDPRNLFDGIVLSYDSGCRKPEAAIFDRASEVCGVPPSRCILIDDLAANCEGAESAGWRAIQFESAAQATAELAALLLPRGTALGRSASKASA